MENKRTCAIVQDLLPAYIDKLTKPETTTFVDAHLTDCALCRKVCRDMAGDMPPAAIQAEKVVRRLQQKRLKRLAIGWSAVAVALVIVLICLLPWPRSISVTHPAVIWRCSSPEEEQLTTLTVNGTYYDYLIREDNFKGTLRVEGMPETQGLTSIMDMEGTQLGIWYENEDAKMKSFGSMFVRKDGSIVVIVHEDGHWDGETGKMITAPASTREEAVALANELADELDPKWLGNRDFE